jgi:TonB family protein
MKSLAVALAVAASLSVLHAQEVYKVGNGVSAPVVVRSVKPDYTAEALAARIEGAVSVETIVQTDGTVGDAKIVKSLDNVLGLDQQAVKAAKQWVFKPGTKDGKAVPVSVTIEMTFTLK